MYAISLACALRNKSLIRESLYMSLDTCFGSLDCYKIHPCRADLGGSGREEDRKTLVFWDLLDIYEVQDIIALIEICVLILEMFRVVRNIMNCKGIFKFKSLVTGDLKVSQESYDSENNTNVLCFWFQSFQKIDVKGFLTAFSCFLKKKNNILVVWTKYVCSW